jgi:hypothetical protein
MQFRKWVAQLDLVALLLFMVVIELVLNRLAVPVLRPTGVKAPPEWHRHLDLVGLFVFHLATALALAVTGFKLWQRVASPGLKKALRLPVAITGATFLVLATWAIFADASPGLAFVLEATFVALLLAILATLAGARADLRTTLGIALTLLPFALHFYGTLQLHLLHDLDEARWSNLPDRLREVGQHAVALAALGTPLLYGPRPLMRAISRPGPMVVSAFVASIGAVILRKHYEVGMELAARGLGMEIGPGAPPQTMALYVSAAAAAVWTVASCITSDARSRRSIGLGLALVIAGGYGFTWPLQYMCGAVGLLTIAGGALRVRDEEAQAATPAARFSSPPIPDGVWDTYVARLAGALGATVVAPGANEKALTRLAGVRAGLPYTLDLARGASVSGGASLESIDLTFGADPAGASPAWTMLARVTGLLGAGAHPPPPTVAGGRVQTGDAVFDNRFRIQDGAELTAKLLDDGLRVRAAATLDGWIAVWPERAVLYRVHPGRGAPLDHPVPVTELAFRAPAEPPGDRLVGVVELLGDLAARTLPRTA